jgi:hypothetical protein
MARTVNEIQQAIITDVSNTSELAPLTANSSKRAIWRLWTYITAVAINLLEQLIDIFKTETETTVSLAAPQTPQWLQDKVFKFQYSATTPQYLQLINYIPQYTTVNTELRIVTRCSIKTTLNNTVLIKVAKSEPPTALVTAEKNALQTYVNTLGVAGVNYQVNSTASDKIYIQANIYYQGAYSSVIQANVIGAINSFLSNLAFDGTMKLSDLEIAIKNTAGVNDIVFVNVKARKDTDALADATYLVQAQTLLSRTWVTQSGYMVGETTSGSTLANTLTFIAE